MSNRKKRAFFRKRGFAPQVSRKTLSVEGRRIMRALLLKGAAKPPRTTRKRPRSRKTVSVHEKARQVGGALAAAVGSKLSLAALRVTAPTKYSRESFAR